MGRSWTCSHGPSSRSSSTSLGCPDPSGCSCGLVSIAATSRVACSRSYYAGSRMDAEPRATDSEIDLKVVYEPGDLEGFDAERQLGEPGQPPYTGGSIRRCTGPGCGRCASTRAWPPPTR